MVRVLWFVGGLIAGVVLAQQYSRTPGGARLLATVNGATGEFVQAVKDSYRARLAEGGPVDSSAT